MVYQVYGPEELPEHIVRYGKRWTNRFEHLTTKTQTKERIGRLLKSMPNWSFIAVPFVVQGYKDRKVHYYNWYAIYERLVR